MLYSTTDENHDSTSKAMHLVTTGLTYPANHKLLDDLFTEVLDKQEDVLPRALEIAKGVVENTSAVSTYLMRELMYRGPSSPEATHLLDSRLVYELFSSKDNKEGVKSFLEKRKANFQGSMKGDAPQAYPWWDPINTGNRPVNQGYRFKPKL